MNKLCQKCQIEKSFNDFGTDKSKKDGKLIYCKICHQEIQREYYKKNSEKQKLKQKLFRDQHKNDPKYKKWKSIQDKKYRQLHYEEIKQRKLKNRDILLKRRRELRAIKHLSNPEIFLLEASKDRARKKGLKHTITLNDIKIPSVCPVLGIPLKPGIGNPTHNSPSIDRIDNNKGYTPDNIVIVSWRVNDLKRNSTIDELEKIVSFYKKF
jgi:hypothetical protein